MSPENLIAQLINLALIIVFAIFLLRSKSKDIDVGLERKITSLAIGVVLIGVGVALGIYVDSVVLDILLLRHIGRGTVLICLGCAMVIVSTLEILRHTNDDTAKK